VSPPQAPGDACQGTFGDLSATFSMQWGSLADISDVVVNGSPDVQASLEVDGGPWVGALRGRAGEDGFLPNATIRLIAQRNDGVHLLLDVAMPIELFEPGYHPLHSFESFGLVGLVDPVSGQFATLGLIGDGGVQLDAASLEPGGTVSGRLTAKASYFVCASTLLAPLLPAPPAPGEVADGSPAGEAAPEVEPGDEAGGAEPPTAPTDPVGEP